MARTATVMVKRAPGAGATRPAREIVARMAELLRARGFDVLRINRFGVSVRAEDARFERELGVRLPHGRAVSEPAHPRDTDLAALVGTVDAAPDPINF